MVRSEKFSQSGHETAEAVEQCQSCQSQPPW